ncbi:MAG: putative peptidoglycan glycosyltransferase FtsW [Legionellaceae bacterium]
MIKKMTAPSQKTVVPIPIYDRYLLFAALALITLGLLMVYSTSIVISEKTFGHPFYFVIRQSIYLILSFILAGILLRIPLKLWEKMGTNLLFISIFLLVLVLVPGIGKQVNGSMRWIGFGPIGFQVSEFAKLSVVVFMAGYLVRREEEVRTQLSGFIKPMILLSLMAILLLKEPDFGAATVVMATALGMMFLAGVRLWQFLGLLALVVSALAILAVSSPYRVARLTTFLNPWAVRYDGGYQLTQSLIAFGRGGWSGVGLGGSVQKLFYLPEAHTDFLLAVLGEELGLWGLITVTSLFILLIARALIIGRKAYLENKHFSAYLAYGLGLWLAFQTMINMGVNLGVLPTKGLTLPLMSYGGSSMLIAVAVIALLLRIDYEWRLDFYGLKSKLQQTTKQVNSYAKVKFK